MIKLENVVLASPEQMAFIIEGMLLPAHFATQLKHLIYRCGLNFYY